MPKIRLEKLIKAERQKVFDIVANYESFQNVLPQYFPSIRVRSVRENVAIIEEHLKLGDKEFVMMAKHITKYPESHEVFVIGGDLKGSHIAEKYEKTPEGTKLTVDADIKLCGMMKIAGFFGKQKIALDLGKVIDELVKIAEA
ncbi:MAG: polyketide cyclase [Nitrososphaerota archaeon]